MYFPLFLNVSNIRFLVVGAGNIALAKLDTILEFSDNILVIGEKINPQIENLAKENRIKLIKDSYDKKYLSQVDIIVAATDDKKVNQEISQDAKLQNKLINAVDDPDISNFIFGANIKRGEVILSIGTSGVSPVLARVLKQRLQKLLPENLPLLSEFLAQNKKLVKEKLNNLQARRLF